jgi:hypothetical protein
MRKELILFSVILFLFSCKKPEVNPEDLKATYTVFEMVDAKIGILGGNNVLVSTPASGSYAVVFRTGSSAVTINNDVYNRKGSFYASSSSSAFTAHIYQDTISVNKYIGGSDIQHYIYFRAVKKPK